MPDVLIRDVPADDLARLDARAVKLGLSRAEYIRRRLKQDAPSGSHRVGVEHLRRLSGACADLADAAAMSDAWS